MSQLNNPLELYRLLPKSNCRQCQMPTCMAFAAAVIKGQKRFGDCQHLDKSVIQRYDDKIVKPMDFEQQLEKAQEQLQRKIAAIDFSLSAERLGAPLYGGKLKIKCLGKDFFVDSMGNITSDCHIITWVTIPILSYIISSAGYSVSGKWVPFSELRSGKIWSPLFVQRFEKPLKQVVDAHTNLLEDILHIFGGRLEKTGFTSDISIVIHPLPKVPTLISYCKPEDDLESNLNVFFDTTAEDNLNIESIYSLCIGLLTMFQKITSRHG